MRITNKYGLPDPVHKFVGNDKYSRGGADVSVTEIIGSPRIRLLRREHYSKMEVDASERFWAALGTAVHEIMRTGANDSFVSEERLFCNVDGWVLSGGIDLQQIHDDGSVTISDYKVTTAFALGFDKSDWAAQLNCYAFLVRHAKGLKVKKLQIIAMLRDWSASARKREGDGYPQAPVVILEQKLWSEDEQDLYVFKRIDKHKIAELTHEAGRETPGCTPLERWQKESVWQVKREGSAKALRNLPTEEAAIAWMVKQKNPVGLSVVEKPGEPTKCAGDYCGVARWCSVWAKEKAREGDQTAPEPHTQPAAKE